MTRGDDPAPPLSAALGRQWGTDVVVDELRRLSGGASRETWAFRATPAGGAPVSLILQRERPGGMRAATGMAMDAALLRAAAATGVPVPSVVAADGDDGGSYGFGAPWLIASLVEGETIPRRILRDEAFLGARSKLVEQFGHALAAVHRIPVDDVPGLDRPEPVEYHRNLLDQLGHPHPAFELGLRWLDAYRPEAVSDTVVHGDFRNGNMVVGPEGLRAVLDWELAHLGDPLEDLGWLCVRAWRFGSDLPVGGFGTRDELVSAYEEASHRVVDHAALRWWEVLGTLRWGVICIVQTTAHRTGASRSVELAAIGRRVCETEHDLLQLLP